MSFSKNLFGTIGSEIFLKITGAVTTIIIARILSINEYGQFALFITVTNSIVAFLAFGIPQSVIYHIGKEKVHYNILLKSLSLIWIVITILSIVIFLFFYKYSLIDNYSSRYLFFIVLYFIVKLLDYLLLSFLRGYNKFVFYNLKRISDSALLIVLLIILYFNEIISLTNVILIHLLLNYLTTFFLYIYLFIKKDKSIISGSNSVLSVSTDLIKFGLKSYIQILVGTLNYQISLLVLAFFLGDSEIGIYSIALSFSALLWFIPNTTGIVLLPTLSSYKDEDKIHEVTAFILRNILYFTIIGAVFLSISGYWLIPFFYGKEYSMSFLPMLILLPGIIGMVLYKILTRNFTSRNKQQISIKTAVIALLINVVLNFMLIPVWDIIGAAIASSFAFLIAGGLLVFFFIKESGLSLRGILLFHFADFRIYKNIFQEDFGVK